MWVAVVVQVLLTVARQQVLLRVLQTHLACGLAHVIHQVAHAHAQTLVLLDLVEQVLVLHL